ncbi:MAG: hypothetical protein ABSG46_10110, partial [Candidatus Binataceae bacterium]
RGFVTGLKSGGETRIAGAVHQLLRERRAPGIVMILSDFLVSAADYEDAFSQLLAAHHEVKAIHIMGDRERDGAYPSGSYRVRDCETGELRDVTFGPATAEACRARAERHGEQVRGFCARRGITYVPAFGAERLDDILKRELPRLGVLG